MATRKKAPLGRGLGAMLSRTPEETEANDAASLRELPLDLIQPGRYQPRSVMDPERLEELASSIRAQGVVQPIVVRKLDAGQYEIIAGERRWRAAQKAGLQDIPAVVRQVSDEVTMAMALIENIQREDLNPMEEAIALKRLQDEFELTHAEVAQAVGKSRTTVTNLLRLIALTDDVKTMLEHGDLEMGHARAMLSLDAAEQRDVAKQVVAKGLSVRQTEALVRKIQQGQPQVVVAQKPNSDVLKLEESLSEKVGVPVSITHSAKGKGKMVLSYNSLDELDGILAHLGYKP